jgi:hypothetical protein
MTEGANGVLEAYEALSPEERASVLAELMRRVAQSDHDVPTEKELVESADQVFLEYDRSESKA